MSEQSFTFFTYTHSLPNEDRWRPTGVPGIFYSGIETARHEVLELRETVMADADTEWPKTYIEKIETHPVSKDSLLTLLNGSIGAFLKSHEVVETID